jgi:hypothetical protein
VGISYYNHPGDLAADKLFRCLNHERFGGYLPKFVRQEFEDYLKCGLLKALHWPSDNALFQRSLFSTPGIL